MITYKLTGIIEGRRFSYSTSDYEWAIKLFHKNKLQSLWKVENNKRKLILKKGV